MCYWNKYIRSYWRSFCPRPTNIVRLSVFLILSIRMKAQTSQGNRKVELRKLQFKKEAKRILQTWIEILIKTLLIIIAIKTSSTARLDWTWLNFVKPAKKVFFTNELESIFKTSINILWISRIHIAYKFNCDAQQDISARVHRFLHFTACWTDSKSIATKILALWWDINLYKLGTRLFEL